MNAVRRYAEIYGIMLRNSLIREMSFKANFLLWMIVEFLWFVGQLVFVEVLFSHVDRIGDWSKWEVVLLIGTHQIISQLFQALFFINIAHIPELVRTGKMDFLLMLPVDSQFAVSVKQFGLDSVVNAMIGVAFVIFSLWKLGVVPTIGQVGLYLVAIGFGVAVHYCIMLMLAAMSFWIVRADGLIQGYFSLFNIGRYPDVIYTGLFKFFFSWVIPIIVVANVPAKILARASESPLTGMLQLVLVAAILVMAVRMLWRVALRNYGSASS